MNNKVILDNFAKKTKKNYVTNNIDFNQIEEEIKIFLAFVFKNKKEIIKNKYDKKNKCYYVEHVIDYFTDDFYIPIDTLFIYYKGKIFDNLKGEYDLENNTIISYIKINNLEEYIDNFCNKKSVKYKNYLQDITSNTIHEITHFFEDEKEFLKEENKNKQNKIKSYVNLPVELKAFKNQIIYEISKNKKLKYSKTWQEIKEYIYDIENFKKEINQFQ